MIETITASAPYRPVEEHRTEGIKHAIEFVRMLQCDPNTIAPCIHSRWCDRMLRLGFEYGPITSARCRTHRLIKPLDAFTELEWRVELALVLGDLVAIEEALHARLYGSTLILTNMTVYDTLSALSLDQGFLKAVATSTHENWRRVKIQNCVDLDDSRVYRRFVDLTETEVEVTLANVVIDIEAVMEHDLRYGRRSATALEKTELW